MTALDTLTAKMAQHGIDRMVLVSDQPVRHFGADGKQAFGATLSLRQIQAIIKEVAPGHLVSQLAGDVPFHFPYYGASGLMNVHVARQDGRLQVDLAPLTVPAEVPAKPSFTPPTAAETDTPAHWYYTVGKIQLGPVTDEMMSFLTASGHINGDTLVRHEGMPDWTQAKLTDLDMLSPDNVGGPRRLWTPPPGTILCDGSGMGEYSFPLPEELEGFNWGAALAPVFWGLANNTWITLWCVAFALITGVLGRVLVSVPLAGFSLWLVLFGCIATPSTRIGFVLWLGSQGNELAWRNRQWNSIEEFKRMQKIWMLCGLALLIVTLLLFFRGLGVVMAPPVRVFSPITP